MKTLLTLTAFLLLTPLPADAQSKPSVLVFTASAAADWVTTHRCLAAGCREDNPLLGFTESRPTPTVLAGAAMDAAWLYAWHKTVGKRWPKLASLGLYVAAGARTALALRNAGRVREQHRINAAGRLR